MGNDQKQEVAEVNVTNTLKTLRVFQKYVTPSIVYDEFFLGKINNTTSDRQVGIA